MGGGAEVSLITFICRVQHVPSRALEVSIIAYHRIIITARIYSVGSKRKRSNGIAMLITCPSI